MHECKNDERIRVLEISLAEDKVDIRNLIKEMSSLTEWIKFLIAVWTTSTLSSLGYLFVKWMESVK